MASGSADGSSPESNCPNMSVLRIVLIGKNGSENSRMSNTILGATMFQSEAASCSQQHSERISGEVEGRNITIINTPHLLQPHLSDYQITQRVRECVSQSAPGPHVIALILQRKDFNKEDRQRVKYVLNRFSEQAIKHTIVITTDEETLASKVTSKIRDNDIHKLIKECGGGHLKFDTVNPGWRSELFRSTEEILNEECEEFLICNMYEDAGDETSVDEDLSRSGASVRGDDEEEDSDFNESTKTGRDGVTTTGKRKLNIVLCGNDSTLKNSVSEIFRGTVNQTERSNVCVKREEKIDGQQISVIELPALSQLSEEEVMRETLHCVSLCHPGVHAFIFIIPDAPINNEDRAEIEEIQRIFSSRINKHIMLLIKQNPEHQTAELNEETQSVIQSLGGRHQFIDLNTQVSVLMEKLEQMIEENSGDCFSSETLMEAQMEKLQKFEEMRRKTHSLAMRFQSQDSREREDELRIVLLGKTGAGKSSTGNTILGRHTFISDISEESVTKECQRETAEINGRHITVIDTPGLFDTELSNEEIQREIRHCIPMILPGPHVFLLLIPVGRFTQEEATAVKIIQDTFGEKSSKYIMVLFTRGDFLKNKTIEEFLGKSGSALNQLIKVCGNRYHVFNNETGDRTQVTDLLQKIDNMVKENGGSYYSCKMFREMEREIQEQQKKKMIEKVEQVNREKEELMNKHKEEKKRMDMKLKEEQQNHEKERKRREEEFREREERYKRNIKDIEEQERKIREELKREREEWEKQKQQERQRREEEEEKWRKKEQAMWDEHNQILKKERERMENEKEDLQSRHEKEKERIKKMMDEERQNNDKERKRREEEFREIEERYKTDMRREREEWEKQKQEARRRRDEDEERRRMMEQKTWDEYNQNLKQEREQMKMKMEEERQNLDKERKRREGEYLKREEQYKRDIKDIEEQERNIREELKREREEWEKQKQQERQREEEREKRRFTELYTGTPEVQHTNNDEYSPSDPGGLRILLLGRTGSGKSATGSTILRKHEFHSKESSKSVTTVCQKGVGEVDGRSVAVIDTPGFDATLTKEQVPEEIMKCISLSAPGPHAFIIVLSVGKITQEEKNTLDMIKMIFGSKAVDFCIVLFTREEDLKTEFNFIHFITGKPRITTIKQYLEENKNSELEKLISECGNRSLVFNNKKILDQTQVAKLFDMIADMNKGRYFTNEMFEEAAISTEQRMEMIEENERQNLAQVKELEANYDTEDTIIRMRLEQKKQNIDEERERLKNKFREQEETLKREFEEKEKSDQKKRETEDQKQSEEEKQQRDEYNQRKEEMKREHENQTIQYEKQQKEREEEDRKREEEHKREQEKMKNDHEHIMAVLRKKQEEEIKKKDSEEQMRKKQEEKEREEWKRKIKEAENDKKEEIKRQHREWEEEKKQQMREKEKEERERREKHEKQLREKQEELVKIREKCERKKEEEEQMIEEEREKLKKQREKTKKDYEEKVNEMERSYEQLERERKEEWKRRKREDEERRVEKRKRWEKMMKDIKQEQEEEIRRREREERERIDREENECDEMKQKHEEEIEKMKKKHEDEARKQREELNDFRKRKEQHIQELKERLEEFNKQLNEVKKLRKELEDRQSCHVM